MRLLASFALILWALGVNAQDEHTAFVLLNSAEDEQNPIISPDGNTLVFTLGNHLSNLDGKRDPGDIWISTRFGDIWTQAVHAGAVLNTKGYNAVAGFSSDGNRLYLLSHYAPDGIAKTQGIAVSQKTSTGWSVPQNISIPYFQNKAAILTGYISPDESTFVFSAESYGSYGVEDIYVSLRNEKGEWSQPKNLGSKINTQFQELTPSLSADGKTLYFSSNGKKGFGSFDVFSATRLDDSWLNWSEPVNIGPSINSDGRELFFKSYAGFDLYTSTKNSDGYGDLKFYKPKDTTDISSIVAQPPLAAPIEITEVKNEPTENTIKVYGQVTNAKNNAVVQAHIVFESLETKVNTNSNAEGSFSTSIPSVNSYRVKIDAPGYVSTIEKLDMNTLEMREVEINFKLQPVEVGTTVNLKSVLFEQSRPTILPESFPELDVVVEFLMTNPNVRIELAGHTDNRGVHSHNVKLSQARVDKVKEYLVSKGISSKRISGKGHGGLYPIADNNNEETRMLNRRVEFTIKKL